MLIAASLALALPPCARDAGQPDAPQAEITETHGDRLISGVYPHLTAYSQSRKSGRLTAQGKLVVANNGARGALDHPEQWPTKSPSGSLASPAFTTK